MIKLTHNQINDLCLRLAATINSYGVRQRLIFPKIYPIPRGGIPVAYLVANYVSVDIVDKPEDADIFVDDLIDSGATMERYCDEYPEKPFLALINKKEEKQYHGEWVVFPWETTEDGHDESATDAIVLAVYIPPHAPAPGHAWRTMSKRSCSSMRCAMNSP